MVKSELMTNYTKPQEGLDKLWGRGKHTFFWFEIFDMSLLPLFWGEDNPN
jgi:hypothetical protein